MWICSRCQGANKDGYNQCVHCSAPRNARRFGARTEVPAPSVQGAGSVRAPAAGEVPPYPEAREADPQTPPAAAYRPAPAQPAYRTAPVKGKSPGGLVRLVGTLLAVLLPLSVLALAVLKADALKPVAEQLWGFAQKAAPVPGAALPPGEAAGGLLAGASSGGFLPWIFYGFTVLLALLFSAAPGLALWALGHIARGIRRR